MGISGIAKVLLPWRPGRVKKLANVGFRMSTKVGRAKKREKKEQKKPSTNIIGTRCSYIRLHLRL